MSYSAHERFLLDHLRQPSLWQTPLQLLFWDVYLHEIPAKTAAEQTTTLVRFQFGFLLTFKNINHNVYNPPPPLNFK